MKICQRCDSSRILFAGSHGRDCQYAEIAGVEHDGYLPSDLGIGGGDSMDIQVCLDCGQMQGKFPHPMTELEQEAAENELNLGEDDIEDDEEYY